MKNVTVEIRRLMEPIAVQCGVSLWDVQYLKEGGEWILRVTIDREGGIDADTCYHFTELANPVIDAADPIEESYLFEVSSPGLGRRLRTPEHFAASIGREVAVRTIRPVDGKRDFDGILKSFSDGAAVVETPDGERSFPLAETAYIKYCDDRDLF